MAIPIQEPPAMDPPAMGRSLRCLLVLTATVATACLPHMRHLEHVDEVQRVLVGGTTRDQVRDELGDPGIVDTPALYVYDWEKAKTLAFGYFGSLATAGFTGTRALFLFDGDGRVARGDVRGTGQGKDDTGEAAEDLPVAAAAPPPWEACADKRAWRAWFAGPEPRLVIHLADGFRFCDARGTQETGRLDGKFLALAIAADGSLAATYERDLSLTLRDGRSFQPIRVLEPPTGGRMSLLNWGLGLSFSADGRRLAASMARHGVTVHDTTSGTAILKLADRWSPRLSPDGSIVVSKGESGFFLTAVDTGRDLATRRPPKYPYGMSPNPYLARLLKVEMGSTAFSPDGRRLAFATCAHVEIWDLEALLASGWEKGIEDAALLPFTEVFGFCAATLRFSADSSSLAIANERTVTLYDLTARKVGGMFTLPMPVAEVTFTPDLSAAAMVVPKGALIWEVGTVAPPAPEAKPSPSGVTVPTG
jgi:hypothetical protein